MTRDNVPAPPWQVSQWFNAPAPIDLADLKGRVVAVHAFQMLCPGCVAHGLPQAQKIRTIFDKKDVVVIGLHTVFEHYEAMTPTSLEAFLHEYRVTFPVGVDAKGDPGPLPKTMEAYGMRGTPTLLLIDRNGFLREHSFGQLDDMVVGARISSLVTEEF